MNGFDNDKYLKIQSEHIKERISHFGDKLYLEFGGKLFDDYHASRVLPGFQPDSKLQMLLSMADLAEIVIVISAEDIVKNKVRGDLGITYDIDVLRLISEFEKKGLYVSSVVITHFEGQTGAVRFQERLEKQGIPSPTGKPKWNREAIDKLLSNEKYTGCVLLQKTISTGTSQIENDGFIERYLYTGSHEAIISDQLFCVVQQEKQSRSKAQ